MSTAEGRVALLELKVARMQREMVAYINAQGPHITETWKEHLAEAFDLEIMTGFPHAPVRVKPPVLELGDREIDSPLPLAPNTIEARRKP